MDFANIFSNLKKNKRDKFSTCYLAATNKNFYGNGPRKLSKDEIENLDFDSVCAGIKSTLESDKTVNHVNLHLPSVLTFGALRILEKEVEFFEEQCKEMVDTFSTVSGQSKKSSKKKTDDLDDSWFEKEIEDIDLTTLFRSPKQKHLIPERDYQLPIDTSFEFNFYNPDELTSITSGIASIDQLELEGPVRFPEEVSNVNETVTPKKTPKRKTKTSHNETPSKRSRKDKDSVPSLSKTAEVTSASGHISGGRFTESSQSRARRSIFPPEDIPQDSSVTDVDEVMQQVPPEDLAVPLQNVPVVTDVLNEPMDQSVPQDTDVYAFPQPLAPQEIPADHVVTDNVQKPASIVQEDRVDEEMMPLPELDDSIVKEIRRKKRKSVFSDDIKTINLIENLTNPKIPFIHVREFTLIKLNFTKVPAKMLLSLPSVCLKLETRKNKIGCTWGKSLASLYVEMIETPCPNVMEETGAGELPRDRSVDKRQRRTGFTVPERPTISYTSMDSAKSVQQSVHDAYTNADDEPGYQEPMLMPLPQLPVEEGQLPTTPGREERAQASTTPGREKGAQPSPLAHKSLPRTPSLGRRLLDSSVAVSPQQRGRPSGADLPQHEPLPASESPIAAPLAMDSASIQRPRHSMSYRSVERSPEASSEAVRLGRNEYFMTKEEFGHFLDKVWTILRNRSPYADLQFDLKVIIVPGESAREEVVVYFNYLCVFEKQEKLQIKQDNMYGTVMIVKLD